MSTAPRDAVVLIRLSIRGASQRQKSPERICAERKVVHGEAEVYGEERGKEAKEAATLEGVLSLQAELDVGHASCEQEGQAGMDNPGRGAIYLGQSNENER